MHKNIEDEIHEMIIVHMSKTYVRPHKHRYNFESLQFIEGTCTVIFFDEKGTILNSFKAGEQNSQNIVYYKIPKDLYHMLIIDSKYLIFKETTKGPFIKENTIFPNWAPDGSDKKEREEFISRIRMNIKNDKDWWPSNCRRALRIC